MVQVLIVLSWPRLTAIGPYGYRLHAQGPTATIFTDFLAVPRVVAFVL